MQNIYLAGTAATPEVDFRYDSHQLSLKGESYPENAQAFYGPLMESLTSYLATIDRMNVQFDVQLAYFNSSSTKLLLELFELLNNAAVKGNYIHLNWFYDEDDDTILEFGQEVADDYPAIDFHPQALTV